MQKTINLIVLFIFVMLIGGCAVSQSNFPGNKKQLSNQETIYILSCINELKNLGEKEFTTEFKKAEKSLLNGSDQDKLRFICLSFHANAEYQEFQQGLEELQLYLAEHQYSSDSIEGLKILVERLDEEIAKKQSSWKSLHEEKKTYTKDVAYLQKRLKEEEVLIKELQQQIEQLKNIESIIQRRESEKQ